MKSKSSMQQASKKKRDRRQWSNQEDEALLDILIEAVNQGQRCNNGQFKAHTLKMTERKIEQKFPGCGIKVKPHIESAMKRLRTVYAIVYDMLNQSGFDWDDEKKMIKVDSDDVWTEYIKSHPNVKDYRYTPILLFDKLALAFGKDRATGKGAAIAPADVVEELDKDHEENDNDELEKDLTQSTSVNQAQYKRKNDYVESYSTKRNRGANIIANSINELGKGFVMWLEKSSEQLDKVINRLGVARNVFDDSRNLLNELKKMDLTEQDCFAVAEKILSMPHRLHIFWGANDVSRLAYVKSLL